MRLVRAQDFKLIQSGVDWVCDRIWDYLVGKFLKTINASRAVVSAITTIMSLDAMMVIRLLLSHYGLGYILKWIWWIGFL